VPAEDKAKIEEAAAKLKQAHGDKNIAAIDAATAELNAAWNEASQKMYAAGADPAGTHTHSDNCGAETQQPSNNEGVTDVDFEEVK